LNAWLRITLFRGLRPIGKSKTRWEDEILEDIKNIKVHNWKKVAQNRDSWKKAVEQDRTLCRL